MSVTDTSLADWSTAAASNAPVGGATPEIDDELRNIKAVCKTSIVALTGNQTVAGVKTLSSWPLVTDTSTPSSNALISQDFADTTYLSMTGDQTAAGTNLFTVFPLTTAAAPTSDYQVANKKYVDDSIYPSLPYVKLANVQTAGTGGGSCSTGSFLVCTLNTEQVDTDSICSLASNRFTLAAGTYEIKASFPFYAVAAGQTRLYNYTDTAVQKDINNNDIYGSSFLAINAYAGHTYSLICSRFTLDDSHAMQVEYRVTNAQSNNGQGYAADLGTTEVYGQVEIIKLS